MSEETRDATPEAAHAAGLNVGEGLDRVLARAAEEARSPKPPPATRADLAEFLDARLEPVEETRGRLAERLAALEAKVDQQATRATAARSTRTQGQHPRGPRLRLPEPTESPRRTGRSLAATARMSVAEGGSVALSGAS